MTGRVVTTVAAPESETKICGVLRLSDSEDMSGALIEAAMLSAPCWR